MSKLSKQPSAGGRVRATRRFSRAILAAIEESRALGIRAGGRSEHRFIGIWSVVVEGRVFARSWTLEPGGWHRTLVEERLGAIRVRDREIRIRGVLVRSERIKDAVERAYAAKYPTPGALKYVRGFRTPRRRDTTIEFVPR